VKDGVEETSAEPVAVEEVLLDVAVAHVVGLLFDLDAHNTH
jgi:hypothetical protein